MLVNVQESGLEVGTATQEVQHSRQVGLIPYRFIPSSCVDTLLAAMDSMTRQAFRAHWAKPPQAVPVQETRGATRDVKARATRVKLAEDDFFFIFDQAKKAQVRRDTVNVKVVSAYEGGLAVTYEGYEGSIPNVQLGPDFDKEAENLVGSELPVKIMTVSGKNKKVMRFKFSHMWTLKKVVAPDYVQTVDPNLKVHDCVSGVVQSIQKYGVFVEIGEGTVGMVHMSRMSSSRVSERDIRKMFKVGDKIKVMVHEIDNKSKRVALDTRQLEPSPGDMLKDPKLVYKKAKETATAFRTNLRAEEEKAKKRAVQKEKDMAAQKEKNVAAQKDAEEMDS